MGAQRHQGLFGALAMSALLLSACSSGTSEPASPVTPAAESAAAVEAADDYRVGDTGPGGASDGVVW